MLMANSYGSMRHSFLYCWLETGKSRDRRMFSIEPQGFGNRFQGLRLCLS
jgi:hypothetical protein